MVLTWMNSIALNIHRSYIRRELLQALPELSTSPKINLAAIDVKRSFKVCKQNDRMVLQRMPGKLQGPGDRAATGVDGNRSSHPAAPCPPDGGQAPRKADARAGAPDSTGNCERRIDGERPGRPGRERVEEKIFMKMLNFATALVAASALVCGWSKSEITHRIDEAAKVFTEINQHAGEGYP